MGSVTDDDDSPMLDPETRYAMCRAFITSSILPRYRKAVDRLLTLPNYLLISAFHQTVQSIVDAIWSKVREVCGGEGDDVKCLKIDLLRFAGNVMFKSDMEEKFKTLVENFLKVSYMLYSDCGGKNEMLIARQFIFQKCRETMIYLSAPDGFEIMPILAEAHNQAVWHIITEIVRRACANRTDAVLLADIAWETQYIVCWTGAVGLESFAPTDAAFLYVVERCYITFVAEKIYDLVIVEYPKSGEVIDDLRLCMERNSGFGRSLLMETLTRDVKEKLLQVGVGTTEILEGYASAVECLRRLDPTCVIMQRICSIIRQYIKQRPDTVRCIITYITGEKREELSEQLTKRRTAFLDEEELMGVNDELVPGGDDVTESCWRKWLPDPPDANPSQSRRYRQNADVFNMLVSVYGSKELFVKEYRELLAERLTKSWNRDPQFEERYLELLKLRFSEGELQQCEVMLKDMRDSEQIDRLVASLLMPEELLTGLSAYARGFEAHKGSRKLEWMSAVGSIELEIELDGMKAVVAVSPAHAAVLSLFTKKETWTVDEMAAELRMDKRNVKKRLEWWQNSGVVYASLCECEAKMWHLASGTSKMERLQVEHDMEEDLSDDEKNEDTEAVDALEQYWTYTKSFIANQEPVKAERLHTIFKMFASPGQHGPTLEDVVAFLQRKVKLNLLSCVNGLYKVVKEVPTQ